MRAPNSPPPYQPASSVQLRSDSCADDAGDGTEGCQHASGLHSFVTKATLAVERPNQMGGTVRRSLIFAVGFDGQKKSRRGTQDANSQHHGRHALTIRSHGGCWCQERRWHRGAGSDLEGRSSELCLWGWGTEKGHAASERHACGDRHAKSHQGRRASHGWVFRVQATAKVALSLTKSCKPNKAAVARLRLLSMLPWERSHPVSAPKCVFNTQTSFPLPSQQKACSLFAVANWAFACAAGPFLSESVSVALIEMRQGSAHLILARRLSL